MKYQLLESDFNYKMGWRENVEKSLFLRTWEEYEGSNLVGSVVHGKCLI